MRLTYARTGRSDQLLQKLSKGTGSRIFQRIKSDEEDIIRHPQAWRSLGGDYRRKLLQQFPYGLVYHRPEPDWVEVLAVMHLHREPDYWRKRTQ